MTIAGFVEKLQEYPSQYKDKFDKPKPSMWAAIVDNTRYTLGNHKWAPVKEGEYISFEASQDAKGYWVADVSTLKKEAAPEKAVAETAGPVTNAGVTRSVANDPRQDSIIYQSQGTRALNFVDLLLRNNLIDFGKAKGAQKIEIVEIYMDNYTQRFFDDVKRLAPPEHDSPVDAETAAAVTAIAKPVRKPKAEAPASDGFEDDDLPF